MLRMKLCGLAALALASWLLTISGAAPAAAVTGELRVLLVAVDAKQPVPRTLRHFEDERVTTTTWTDPSTLQHFAFERDSSFASLFAEMSDGQLTILGDTAAVAFPDDAADHTWSEWIAMANAAVASQGYDPASYDRALYLLPHLPSDATTAGLSQGDVGWCAPSSYVELGCLFHELGHTIGLSHAGELLPDGSSNGIGDDSDGLMGSGFSCQVNVVNQQRAGWLGGSRLATFDVAGSSAFTIAAQSSTEDVLQAVEIRNNGARPKVGVVDTFLSFRNRKGFDEQLAIGLPDLHGDEVHDAVLVHQSDRLFGGDTLYLRALEAGESYSEHGVTVTVTGISGHEADVEVTRDPYRPEPHEARVVPANLDGEAGSFQFFDLAITNHNEPALIDFDSHYDASFTPIGPDWVMGFADGFARTVAPGTTRSFPLLVMSPPDATPGRYDFAVTVTEWDGDDGPYTVLTRASYTVVEPAPPPGSAGPDAPTDLEGSTNGLFVSLTWNAPADSTGIVGYEVFRATVGSGFTSLGTTLTPGFTDYGSAQGVPWQYVVRTFDGAYNLSPMSNAFSILLADTLPPDAPTGLTVAAAKGAVVLSWEPAKDNVAVAGYDVLRDGVAIASTVPPHFSDTSFEADRTYRYTARAFDAEGNTGPESDPLTATIPPACGLGPELVLVLPGLMWLHRRQRR